jgi:hypothetical protein
MTEKEKQQKYYLENKEKMLKRSREYWKKNKEKLNRIERDRYRRENNVKPENYIVDEYGNKINGEKSAHKTALRNRKSILKTKYGITLEEFNCMLKDQNNSCAICGCGNEKKNNYGLCVDHCHKSGKVRRLLCNHCNLGLGYFGDDIELMKKAIEYLIKYK